MALGEEIRGDVMGCKRLDDHIDIAYWRHGLGCCFSWGSAFYGVHGVFPRHTFLFAWVGGSDWAELRETFSHLSALGQSEVRRRTMTESLTYVLILQLQ